MVCLCLFQYKLDRHVPCTHGSRKIALLGSISVPHGCQCNPTCSDEISAGGHFKFVLKLLLSLNAALLP